MKHTLWKKTPVGDTGIKMAYICVILQWIFRVIIFTQSGCTVGSKIIRALEIIRVKKLTPNAVCPSYDV